jgi:predicted RND superfamily exporter protein
LVGFSVDYIVHIAHQYVESPYTKRKERVRNVYQNIGLACFSGAATTLIAVTFLLFTKIYVLRKFGIIMQLTLGFSIIYALIVMPALLATLGPNGYFGNIWRPLKKFFVYLKMMICLRSK